MRRMFSLEQLKGIADNEVKSLVEGGTLNNAKPIYWHSCTFKRVDGTDLIYYCDCIVINNEATPFTLTSFLNWLRSLPADAEIKVVQGYDFSHASALVSSFSASQEEGGENNIIMKSINLSTGAVYTEEYGFNHPNAVLTDNGVNKIN